MFTITQQGEQDSMFYTVEYNGNVVEHYSSLESAAMAVEDLKRSFASVPEEMHRWFFADAKSSGGLE